MVFEKKTAFLVGINEYQSCPSLTTPINDINGVGLLLNKKFDFQLHSSINPSKKELLEFLRSMEKLINIENSQTIFYFAGHGTIDPIQQGFNGYLIPEDGQPGQINSWISMDLLLECIEAIPSKQLLIILDCCFAGTFRLAGKFRNSNWLSIERERKLYQQHFHYFTRHQAWQVITSASHKQYTIDHFGDRNEQGNLNSPFAKCFIDAIDGQADINNDDIITAAELYTYLQNKIPVVTAKAGNQQNVGFFPLNRHENGEFLLIPSDFLPSELPLLAFHNPYKGLQPYEPENAAIFFGRKKAIHQLHQKINRTPFTLVLGASGAGKSSLVRAGIIPILIQKGYQVELIRPGENPLQELENKEALDFLIIDQFEELITRTERSKDVLEFLKNLRTLLQQGIKIITILRIDYESQFDKTHLSEYWNEGRFIVPPFSTDELNEIIVKPATRAGHFFHPNTFVNRIVNDVQPYPGSLPLLSFILKELFEKCQTDSFREIKEKDYVEMGGISGALQQKADAIFNSLAAQDQLMFKNLMLRMVSQKGGDIAGKRVFRNELTFVGELGTSCQRVISNLDKERLIICGDQNGRPYIEPVHDALVRSWGRLRRWLVELNVEKKITLRNSVIEATNKYFENGERTEGLWHQDYRLNGLKIHSKNWWISFTLWWKKSQTAFDHLDWVTTKEKEFLIKSLAKQKRNTRNLWSAVLLVILTLTTAFIYANTQQKIANNKNRESRALYYASEAWNMRFNDPTQALRLLQEANQLHPNHPSILEKIVPIFNLSNRKPFYRQAFRHNYFMNGALFSSDESEILTYAVDSTARLWSQFGEPLLTMKHSKPHIKKAKFSSNNEMILTLMWPDTAFLWNKKGQILARFNHKKEINDIDISEHNLIITAAKDSTIKIWNTNGQFLKNLSHNADVTSATFLPQKKILATAGNSVFLWSDQGERLQVFPHEQKVRSTHFSPKNNFLITASENQAHIWDSTGAKINTLTHDTVIIKQVKFSPNENYIATVTDNNYIYLWDLNKAKVDTFFHRNEITDIRFSHNSRELLFGSRDNCVILWSFSTANIDTFYHDGHITSVNMSFDGKKLLTASDDYTAKLWEKHSNVLPEFSTPEGVYDINLSPNDKIILSAMYSGKVILWNTTGDCLKEFQSNLIVPRTRFSPKDSLILIASKNCFQLWSFKGEPLTSSSCHEGKILTAKFSNNGKYIITASTDSTAKLWKISGQLLQTFSHKSTVTSAIFADDGKSILTSTTAGEVINWDLDAKVINRLIHPAGVNGVLYFNNEKNIITKADDKKLRFWSKQGKLLQETLFEGQLYKIDKSSKGDLLLVSWGNIEGFKPLDRIYGAANLLDHQGIEIATYPYPEGIGKSIISNNGNFILSGFWKEHIQMKYTPKGVLNWLDKNIAPLSEALKIRYGIE